MPRKSKYLADVDPETLAWWSLTLAQRFVESQKLWATFLALGGSLDPEPDRQSPFYFPEAPSTRAVDGGSGVRVVRRRGVHARRRSGRSSRGVKPVAAARTRKRKRRG